MEDNKIINLDAADLGAVSGGAATSEATKLSEFKRAWASLGFESHGYTSHLMQAFFEEWKEAGYKPAAARDFLKKYVSW